MAIGNFYILELVYKTNANILREKKELNIIETEYIRAILVYPYLR